MLTPALGGTRTGADPPGEDPGPCGDGGFDQTFPKHLLEFRWQLEVLETSMDGDQQGGELQLPLLHQQLEEGLRPTVERDADVLEEEMGGGGGGRERDDECVCVRWVVRVKRCVSVCVYHGLVDMPPLLELDDPVRVSGCGLCVFQGIPSFCGWDIHIDQWCAIVRWSDASVLSQQPATATPDQNGGNVT